MGSRSNRCAKHERQAELTLDAGWRNFTYSDQLGNSYQDASGVLIGARWFF
jgi:hypothetical protein